MPVQLIAGSTLVLPSQPVPTTCMTTHKCAGAHTRRLRAKISSCRAVSIPFIRHVHRRCLTRSYSEGNSHMPSWAAETPTWNPSTRMQMNHLMVRLTAVRTAHSGLYSHVSAVNSSFAAPAHRAWSEISYKPLPATAGRGIAPCNALGSQNHLLFASAKCLGQCWHPCFCLAVGEVTRS